MKKFLLMIFLVITMLFISPFEGHSGKTSTSISVHYKAGHGYRGRHYKPRHGHGWGHHRRWRHHHRGPRFYWRGSIVIPWYPYGYYAPPPVIIQKQAPVYVQPQQEEDNYWYYCPDPQGYYPYIRDCASGWMKVVPDVTPPNP